MSSRLSLAPHDIRPRCLATTIPTPPSVEPASRARLPIVLAAVTRLTQSAPTSRQGCAEAARVLRGHMGLAVAGRDVVRVSHILIKHSASRKTSSRLDAAGEQIRRRSVRDARATLIQIRRCLVADCASLQANSPSRPASADRVITTDSEEAGPSTSGNAKALGHMGPLFAAAARNFSDCNRCLACSLPHLHADASASPAC